MSVSVGHPSLSYTSSALRHKGCTREAEASREEEEKLRKKDPAWKVKQARRPNWDGRLEYFGPEYMKPHNFGPLEGLL